MVKTDEDREEIEKAHGFETQATIVLVMKACKKLDHEILFSEVYKILKNRFILTRELFKKQIQELMEKNRLERKLDNNKQYLYIS